MCVTNCFYNGHQATNLAVLFVARSTDLDRRRYIGGLFWSTNMTPRRVHFLPPPLLCESKSSMCRQLREMGGGADCALLCYPQPGSFKARKQLITAVSNFIRRCQDEQLESC